MSDIEPCKKIPLIDAIKELVGKGVLGREEWPEQKYWHWSVVNGPMLPTWALQMHGAYGEIRWFGTGEICEKGHRVPCRCDWSSEERAEYDMMWDR